MSIQSRLKLLGLHSGCKMEDDIKGSGFLLENTGQNSGENQWKFEPKSAITNKEKLGSVNGLKCLSIYFACGASGLFDSCSSIIPHIPQEQPLSTESVVAIIKSFLPIKRTYKCELEYLGLCLALAIYNTSDHGQEKCLNISEPYIVIMKDSA